MAKINTIALKIPNLGEAESTEIIEVNIKVGDKVNVNDPLIVLESEKAAMEVPSDFQGEISEILIKEGDSVHEGIEFAKIKAETEAKEAEVTARNIFTDNNLSTDLPTIKLGSEELDSEILLSDMICRINFASSKSASRKLIRGNAVKIDRELINDELFSINTLLRNSSDGLVISVGKKKYFRVVTVE